MGPHWRVELVGDNLDLELLAALFEDGVARVKRIGDKFWLESERIPARADTPEVVDAAEAIVRTLNGIVALTDRAAGPVSVGSLVQVGPAGGLNIVVIPKPAVVRARTMPVTVTVGGVRVAPKTERFLVLALADAEVDHVLRIYADHVVDWRDLYAIIEVVERDIRPQTIADRGWSSQNEVDCFTHTANSRDAIGTLARHGKTFKAPKNPMTLAQARGLIGHVVDRWLLEKVLLNITNSR